MKVDMNLLKELREITHAPLKDCKDCLVEANGDLGRAQEILKEKGITKAAKKADRLTKEGIVKVRQLGDKIIGIKLACETDFVAKNESFHALAEQVIDILDKYNGEVNNISEIQDYVDQNIVQLIQEKIGSIGENMVLADLFIRKGNAYIYLHPGDKIATIVFYKGDEQVAKELALQITAMNPDYKDVASVPVEQVAKMKEEFKQELKESGKPENMWDNIIQGKLNKAFAEFVLTEQIYIRDDSKKIKNIIPEGFSINEYIRFSI